MSLNTDEVLANAKETSTRFKGADFFTPGIITIVLGAGGIGSHVAYLLTSQEAEVVLYDPDTIEEHNLGTQLFISTELIGSNKAEALQEILSFRGSLITPVPEKFTQNSELFDKYVFSCFDNMEGRKEAFEKWCALEDPDKIFIDGRMLADQGQIYVVTPGKEEAYKKTLFDDSEVEEGPCSNRATAFCAFYISSLMVSYFNNHLANLKYGEEVKEVPFGVRFILAINYLQEIKEDAV